MPLSLPTTRRGRFLFRRERYLRRKRRYNSKKWKWDKQGLKTIRVGPNAQIFLIQGKQQPQGVSSASFDAVLLDHPALLPPFTITGGFYRDPPHIHRFYPPPLTWRDEKNRPGSAVYGFHRRRVQYLPSHVTLIRRTKRERQINGANWHYANTGFFPDWDILGRHPNLTDAANGVPAGPAGWPVPLGF